MPIIDWGNTPYFDPPDRVTQSELDAAVAALRSAIGQGGGGAATLADGVVATAKLADGAVTTGKLDSAAVSTGKIATGAVTAAKLADDVAADPRLRAAFVPAAPVLSAFVYDSATGNLTSYKEDGVTITLTYNGDGTVATMKRGTGPTQTFTYSGGNLVGVA